MRTIKFRGKAAESGKWIYGDLIENQGDFHIYYATSETTLPWDCDTQIAVCAEKVDFKTVGQFTGLHDKNGKEIYEGDILKFVDNENTFTSAVGWNNEVGAWCITFEYEVYVGVKPLGEWLCEYKMEVVGNIHDNPELPKGGEE